MIYSGTSGTFLKQNNAIHNGRVVLKGQGTAQRFIGFKGLLRLHKVLFHRVIRTRFSLSITKFILLRIIITNSLFIL